MSSSYFIASNFYRTEQILDNTQITDYILKSMKLTNDHFCDNKSSVQRSLIRITVVVLYIRYYLMLILSNVNKNPSKSSYTEVFERNW